MNLQRIQASIASFKKYLRSPEAEKELYKWESVQSFQSHWDLEHPDFAEIYKESLKNSTTNRLWKIDNYTPKRMMLEFLKMNPDYGRHIFKDLFNDSSNIADRIDRFIFYCDDFLAEYKTTNPLSIENNHYHDYYIISLYLTFRYPENYTLYDFNTFQQGMIRLGSRAIPELNDMERYFKVCRTLWKFLEKDEEVWSLHQKRLYHDRFYKGKSLLLVHEFFKVIVEG